LIKLLLILTLLPSPLFAGVAEWKRGIAAVESAADGYAAYNKHTKALGKYQFVPRWWWQDIVSYAKINNIPLETHQDFLDNPELQENYMTFVYENYHLTQAEMIAEDVCTVFDLEEIAALIHFKGYKDARSWIKTGIDPTSKNNVSIRKYLEVFNRHRKQKDVE
jgi:hypothetical protein